MKDDMISRRAAIDALRTEIIKRRLEKDTNDDGLLDEYDAEWVLRQLLPAQPPKEIPKSVVRCRECKYSRMTVNGECKYCDIWFPDEAEYLDGDYYCASGERKDGDGNG